MKLFDIDQKKRFSWHLLSSAFRLLLSRSVEQRNNGSPALKASVEWATNSSTPDWPLGLWIPKDFLLMPVSSVVGFVERWSITKSLNLYTQRNAQVGDWKTTQCQQSYRICRDDHPGGYRSKLISEGAVISGYPGYRICIHFPLPLKNRI